MLKQLRRELGAHPGNLLALGAIWLLFMWQLLEGNLQPTSWLIIPILAGAIVSWWFRTSDGATTRLLDSAAIGGLAAAGLTWLSFLCVAGGPIISAFADPHATGYFIGSPVVMVFLAVIGSVLAMIAGGLIGFLSGLCSGFLASQWLR